MLFYLKSIQSKNNNNKMSIKSAKNNNRLNKRFYAPIYVGALLLISMSMIYIIESAGMSNREMNLDFRTSTEIKLANEAIKSKNSLCYFCSKKEKENKVENKKENSYAEEENNDYNEFIVLSINEEIEKEMAENALRHRNLLLNAIQ